MFNKIMNRRGFTLIELMISLVMGMIVLSAALSFAVMTWRTVESNHVRDEVYRNARFVAMSLERDFQTTGVGIASTIPFGTLAVGGDTVIVLRVPYDPDEAPIYDLVPPAGVNNPLDPGGTCGNECVDLQPVAAKLYLQPQDLARLQVNDERRLILIQSVSSGGGPNPREVWFTYHANLARYAAGLSGGLLLDRFSTFVQKLEMTAYWVESGKLMRARRFNLDGTLEGEILSYGVQKWEVSLLFTDGDEADQADPTDADATNDFDDIVGVRIQATLAADRPHPNINDGNLFTRDYEWWFAPRNLMYERNRIS